MIKYELINSVGKITLNRPEKYHSFVREMALQLQEYLKKEFSEEIIYKKYVDSVLEMDTTDNEIEDLFSQLDI